MAQAKRSSIDNVVKVDPRSNRPRNAEESVPEALVPDVVRTDLQPGDGSPAADSEGAAAPDRWQRIRQRAYELAQARGFAPGAALNDWLQAEREIDNESTLQAPPEDQFTG